VVFTTSSIYNKKKESEMQVGFVCEVIKYINIKGNNGEMSFEGIRLR